MEPAQELTGRALHRRPEAEPLESLVVTEEYGDDPGPHLVTGGRLAAIEEAHDLGIAVQLKQVVLVRRSETTQHQTIGLEENPHPGTLPWPAAQVRPHFLADHGYLQAGGQVREPF